MLDFKQLETCLKDKRFVDGLQEINNEIAYIKNEYFILCEELACQYSFA